MSRFGLCCLVCALLAPVGCIGSQDGDDDDVAPRVISPGPRVRPISGGPCTGEECNGRMPYGAGCEEDDVVLATQAFTGGRIALHHSPACGTKWAVVHRDERRYSIAWVEEEDGSGEAESNTDRARTSFSSAMLHAPETPVRACVQPLKCKKACENAYATPVCTDYR